MRDGICWDAGHVGICGDMRGYAGICGDMRDGPPPRNRPGRAAVFGPVPPQSTKGGKWEREITSDPKKKNAYFQFKLLIINDINQYFNIHLHLISFIIYNR